MLTSALGLKDSRGLLLLLIRIMIYALKSLDGKSFARITSTQYIGFCPT